MAVEDNDTESPANQTQDDESVIGQTLLYLYKNSIHVKVILKLLFKMKFLFILLSKKFMHGPYGT